jgi:hypothetical protein
MIAVKRSISRSASLRVAASPSAWRIRSASSKARSALALVGRESGALISPRLNHITAICRCIKLRQDITGLAVNKPSRPLALENGWSLEKQQTTLSLQEDFELTFEDVHT